MHGRTKLVLPPVWAYVVSLLGANGLDLLCSARKTGGDPTLTCVSSLMSRDGYASSAELQQQAPRVCCSYQVHEIPEL